MGAVRNGDIDANGFINAKLYVIVFIALFVCSMA